MHSLYVGYVVLKMSNRLNWLRVLFQSSLILLFSMYSISDQEGDIKIPTYGFEFAYLFFSSLHFYFCILKLLLGTYILSLLYLLNKLTLLLL